MSQNQREKLLTMGLDLKRAGIEISPLYRPTVRKNIANVFYTDYCSAEESRRKHAGYVHDEIMEIDFIWTPGKSLNSCVHNGSKFNWAISSHVMEHVPNPIGWLLEIFNVLETGAIYSIALPDKRYCYDKFRRETDAADLIDVWVRGQSVPSPYQLFDFLSRSVDGSGAYGARAFDTASKFEDAKRHYTDEEALSFVFNSWTTGAYYDAHCSAFTPDSFVEVFQQLNRLGILNVEISEPVLGHEEFFVQLKKLGEPKVSHPGNAAGSVESLQADLDHARKAFEEAVKVQYNLKKQLQLYLKIKAFIPSWFRRLFS